jgi:hypothetical protein
MLRSTSASSQAETVYVNNDAGRLIARNATFLSEQDTLQLKGYANAGGYVVQARTVSASGKGFVFLHSRLTHGPGPSAGDVPTGARAATNLARSPGGTASVDNVAYIECQMDDHILPIGWAYNTGRQPVPNPAVASAAAGWREYGTTDRAGVPLALSSRVGGYVLPPAEVSAGFATRAQIFAAFAGWNPQP